MEFVRVDQAVVNGHRVRPTRWMAAGMVAALVLAGCGSGDSGDIGSEVSPANPSADETLSDLATETDDTAAESEDSLVDQASDTTAYAPDPLPAENSGEALAALVEDIHGPTADLSRDMNRLTRFPAVPTPAGAHVMSLQASSANIFADDRTSHIFEVQLVVDEQPDLVQSLFDGELTAAGWTKTGTEYDTDSLIDQEHERRIFARTTENDEQETLSVTSIVDSQTGLNLSYKVTVVDEALKTRFAGWPAVGAPIPDGVSFNGAFVNTKHGPGETFLSFSSELLYENAADPSIEGLLTEVEALATAGPYPIEVADVSGVALTVEGYDFFRVGLANGLLKPKGERVFATPELGAAVDAPVGESSTDPIPANATADQFAALLGDMHGPTEDVSAQMRRLGPFPELPTPLGADIVSLDTGVNLAPPEPDSVGVVGAVEFAVAGDFDEIDTFYRAQLAAGGWVLKTSEPKTDDPDVQRVVHSYTHDDVIGSAGFPLVIDIADRPANANVHVILDYNEYLPASAVDTEPWLGWEGNAPIPAGGQLIGVSVSSRRWAGDAASLTSTYNLADLDLEAVLPAVEAASPGSDYTRNPDLDRTGFGDLDFTHPSFERVGAVARSGSPGANLSFEARFPFTR